MQRNAAVRNVRSHKKAETAGSVPDLANVRIVADALSAGRMRNVRIAADARSADKTVNAASVDKAETVRPAQTAAMGNVRIVARAETEAVTREVTVRTAANVSRTEIVRDVASVSKMARADVPRGRIVTREERDAVARDRLTVTSVRIGKSAAGAVDLEIVRREEREAEGMTVILFPRQW